MVQANVYTDDKSHTLWIEVEGTYHTFVINSIENEIENDIAWRSLSETLNKSKK